MKTRNGYYAAPEVSSTSIVYKEPSGLYIQRRVYTFMKNMIGHMMYMYMIFCVSIVSGVIIIVGSDYYGLINNY